MGDAFIDYLKEELVKLGKIQSIEQLNGCTSEEVAELQIRQKVDYLPKLYRDFMFLMGRQVELLLWQETCDYPDVRDLKDWVLEQLEEVDVNLPQDAFIFSGYGGYIYKFFRTNDKSDDPATYEYILGRESNECIKAFDSFSIFLNRALDRYR
jgi:hypothetical protein